MSNFQKTIFDLGVIYSEGPYNVIFGNKKLTEQKVKELFPYIEYISLNQKHSTNISKESQFLEISDGHQWSKTNFACGIRTADCLPLIAINHSLNQITNLHCGRKGLIDGILSEFLKISDVNSTFSFFIGPHIETYEIGQDLYEELKTRFKKYLKKENEKYYFSLSLMTKDFIVTNFKSSTIYECKIDTYINNNYWSYRKDKLTSFRNLSFAFMGSNEKSHE